MATLFCGTSGYAYSTWKPDFYPEKLAAKKFLGFYATRLNAVEINYTYHRLPSRSTLEGWISETPENFVLCLKAHMRITHLNRLKRTDFTPAFFNAIDGLRVAKRLGVILFQLPPNLQGDPGLLREFVQDIPADIRCAFEFRHKSWFTEETYGILEDKGIALCLAESEKLVVPERLTAPFAYFRLRKPNYTEEDRTLIAAKLSELMAEGRDTYVFFKHEETPEGALHAEALLRQLAFTQAA
jgi:uncharacterized protein YecE (DUF72 family)